MNPNGCHFYDIGVGVEIRGFLSAVPSASLLAVILTLGIHSPSFYHHSNAIFQLVMMHFSGHLISVSV